MFNALTKLRVYGSCGTPAKVGVQSTCGNRGWFLVSGFWFLVLRFRNKPETRNQKPETSRPSLPLPPHAHPLNKVAVEGCCLGLLWKAVSATFYSNPLQQHSTEALDNRLLQQPSTADLLQQPSDTAF